MSSRYDPRAHGAQCDICPLKTCKPVAPESDQMSDLARLGGVGIAVVSNSPGEQEERQGRAFVGQAGDELNKALRSAGIPRSNVHFTYALLCRPPGDKLSEFIRRINQQNRENQKLAKAAGREAPVPVPSPLDCCAPRLEREIEPYEKFITLGGTAFTAVTGSTASVMAVRGGLTALDATIRTPARQVMPTLHPTLVRKQQRWAHVFRNDIAKAGRWFRGQSKWIPPHVIYHPSPDVLRQFLSDRTRIYTFDLETDGVESLTAKIRCVGIGFEDVGVLCGILGKDGFTKFYPPDVEVEIIQILSDFFTDPGIVKAGHNAGYYDKIVLQQQWGITTTPIIDTMLLHRSVESELPHGLAYVGSMYTEAPSWKTDRSGNKLSYGSETDEELHEYCLFEGTRIVLANGSTEAIETIVRQKQKVEVLSMDAQGSLVPGAIVDWKYATEEAIDWWVIQVKGQRSKDRGLVLTADHQVCVENKGWVEAQKVNIGDRLYDAEPAFTYDELAALCGTLLGDSTLGVAPDCRTAGISGARSAYLQGGHSTASGFASWKEKELWFIRTGPELPGKDVEVEGRAGVSGPFTPLKSKNYRQLADLGAKIYDERNRHRLRVSTLDFMGLRGLAWLYVDDGCLQRMPGDRQDTMVFSTQRYLREDIDAAVAWFREKWGAASAGTDGVLRVGAVASRKLAQAIAPYLPEEARYKLPSIEGVDWAAVPYYPVQGGSESQASTREVISVGPYVPDTATRQGSYRAKRRYCLTVEGTQCFFTNYGLVHNCGNDVAVTARVLSPLVDQVGLRGQIPVWQLDQKMQSICADMHTAGMCVNQTVRLSEEKRLLTRRFELLQDIRDRLGIPSFNPGSVYQVRDILFEKWQLTPPLEDDDRFTSSGDPSTADLVLRSLLTDRAVDKDQRSLIKLLRYYRKVQKVLGTYVVKLRPWNMKVDDDLGWDDEEEWSDKEARTKYGIEKRGIVNPRTGRMHPGYNAHVAVTGRLSSSKPINCFDGETEILTEQGWIRFDALPRGLRVAQWHNDKSIEFVEPTAYHEGVHEGSMVAFQSQSADLLMTPNHRLPLIKNTGMQETVTALDLLNLGAGRSTFHAGRLLRPERDLDLSCAEIKLLVAIHADGSFVQQQGKAYGVDLGFTKLRKIERMRTILTCLDSRYAWKEGETEKRFYISSTPRLEEILQLIGRETRQWGAWLFQLSETQASIFEEELWHWDACNERRSQYANKDEVNADWIQAFLCLHGIRANKRFYTNTDGNSVWVIDVRRTCTNAVTDKATRSTVLWSDKVYCVTVPSDAIVVRRRGKVTITRQSQNFPKEMRAMIIPAPGHVLVGADMDQLELRIAAARWGVALYLRAFEDGKDPHSMTAFAVFGDAFLAATGLTADQFRHAGKLVSPSYADGKFIGTGEDKKMRDLSKAVQYASQYMAKAETVHKLICKTEVPSRGSDGKLLNDGTTDLPYALLPFKRVREMRDNWLKGAPEFASGWEQEIQAYRDTGYIREDVTGRRRDFLDGEAPNEIVNFPIQCVPGNTRVLTEFGYVPIRELQGRTFRAWTGKRWASATCIEKGKAKLKEVRTDHAVRLVCDKTHRFKVPQRSAYAWVEAAALAPGSRVAMDLARPLPFGFLLPADDAYMLGLYVGDGCLSRKDKGRGRSVALSFTIGKTSETGDPGRAGGEAVDRAVDYCLARGLHPRTQEHEGHWVVHCTNEVTYWAEAWGLNPGLNARDKRIPESIWRADLDARKAFLRGLLDADGYQCPDGAVHLNLCNPDLLEEVAILSRTAGVDALSLSGPHKTNKKGQHTSWRLVLAGAHAHKQLGWGRACKYRSNYTIPQFECTRIVEHLKPTTASHRTMKSRIRGHGGAKSITPYSAVEMGVSDLYDHGVVTGVLDLGIEVPVYTLVVDDPDHQYVANGFIAKNSSAAGLMNRAIVQLHEAIPLHKWGPGTGIINQCHDSIVVECPEAEAPKVIGLLEECLNQTHASLPGVIFSASAETGMTWKAVG